VPPDDDIQEDGTAILKEYTVRHQGIWRVHQQDADDKWPSDFHAHNLDDGREKLDIYTGEVYDIVSREKKYQLKGKAMRYIYAELRDCGNDAIAKKCTNDPDTFPYLD
jgi:hypothetical protein